ncbi:MAG: hypothetical protein FJ316_08145 [SAR202 cluster bacterium]|nr:hypothetical protein [SAR202 cluster bacterium]
MNLADWVVAVIRWGHALAAVAWVGGGMFYALVLRPAWRGKTDSPELRRSVAEEFRGLVNTAIGVLLITGVVLSAVRLTGDGVTWPYVAVLAVKIVLALYMFYVARFMKGSPPGPGAMKATGWRRFKAAFTGTTGQLITGVVIIGLADVLDALFEQALVR